MTHEYQRQSTEQLITQQTAAPRSADVVFNENQTLWQTLGFSQSQVSLWLASLPQSNHLKESTTATYQLHLMLRHIWYHCYNKLVGACPGTSTEKAPSRYYDQ